MRRRRYVLSALLLTTGCGYFQSGVWENDPSNWERAFRSAKPDDVVVVHSTYWRTPHWSYEAGYIFEIAANPKLREQLFRENRFLRLEGAAAVESKSLCFSTCPAWFAPKAIEEYDVWGYADEPRGNFRVLIEKKTGTMFVSDFQV